jgi:CheY-like chemotaxis protein
MDDVRLMVVDDSADLRDLLTLILDRPDLGWHVVGSAADGQQALDALPSARPDVVLLDLSMPVMDGLEALPLIRRDAPHAVVVMLSGYPREKFERTARDAGADGYLEKKDLVSDLLPKLRGIIDARTAVEPPAQRKTAAENGARATT